MARHGAFWAQARYVAMELLKQLTIWCAVGAESVAGAIIAIAVLEAALRTVALLIRREHSVIDSHEEKEEIRLRLGRWLALALEFELGADILRTAVAPTWSEIGQLGAVATIRTALNFFLQQEIDRAAMRRAQPETAGAGKKAPVKSLD